MKPEYGNWVSTRPVSIALAMGLVFAGLAVIFPILVVAAILFLAVAGYFAYARFVFGNGGNAQEKIRPLVVTNLEWERERTSSSVSLLSRPRGLLTVPILQA